MCTAAAPDQAPIKHAMHAIMSPPIPIASAMRRVPRAHAPPAVASERRCRHSRRSSDMLMLLHGDGRRAVVTAPSPPQRRPEPCLPHRPRVPSGSGRGRHAVPLARPHRVLPLGAIASWASCLSPLRSGAPLQPAHLFVHAGNGVGGGGRAAHATPCAPDSKCRAWRTCAHEHNVMPPGMTAR